MKITKKKKKPISNIEGTLTFLINKYQNWKKLTGKIYNKLLPII
jgi:hypothetical protein